MLNSHLRGGNKGSDFPLAGKNPHRTVFRSIGIKKNLF